MNKRLEEVKLNPVRYYSRLIKDFPQGIDLTMGEGHFNSPFNAKLKAYEALIKNQTKYSQIEGDFELRNRIIKQYYPRYTTDNIVITNGATQALFSVLLSIISDKEDEIIIIGPYYPAYMQTVNLLGGTPVLIDSSLYDFKINPRVLKDYVTEKTKAIIINEPHNPTGITYTKDEKLELMTYFKTQKCFIIVDEIYKQFTDLEFVAFTDLIEDEFKSQFIFMGGLSKSHLMTGYRIGYIVCHERIVEYFKKINYLSISSISTVMQKAAIGALDEVQFVDFVTRYYLNNVKILCDALDDLKVNYVKATGGYYLFMDISGFKMTSQKFCEYLGKNYHIALVPGELFGDLYDKFVRISCCKDVKDIIKFVNVFTDFIEIAEKNGDKTN